MAKAAKARKTPRQKLEEVLRARATISPEELYAASSGQMGGRNTIYDACERGDIECFRNGKRIFIPTAPLRRKLGLEAA